MLNPHELLPAPSAETGWRLAREFWGRAYASEAARAALETGFQKLHLHEIIAFTAVQNLRSRAVVSRIGMAFEGETFEHPGIAPGHPLKKHVLYRLKNPLTASPPQ